MSPGRSMSPEAEDMSQLEDLAMQHTKELADLQVLQELDIKHARQRLELRAKQEAEMARRKRERDAKLNSVAALTRGQKRRRVSVHIAEQTVTQNTSSTNVKLEEGDGDVVIISSSKRSRHEVGESPRREGRGSSRRSQTPLASEPIPTPVSGTTTNTVRPSDSTGTNIDQGNTGLPQIDLDQASMGQQLSRPFALLCSDHKCCSLPLRESPNLFLSPRQSEQPEDVEAGDPPQNPAGITIKCEFEGSDVPYLEIGNLQPGSFQQDFPMAMQKFYPPHPSRSSPTPPRSPPSLAQSDHNLISTEHSSLTEVALSRISSPPRNMIQPQATIEASSQDPDNVTPFQPISTITLATPISGTMEPLESVFESSPKLPVSSSLQQSTGDTSQKTIPPLKESTESRQDHLETIPEKKKKSITKLSAARMQQPPKKTPGKPDSSPKVVTTCVPAPQLQKSPVSTRPLPKKRIGSMRSSTTPARVPDSTPKVRIASLPTLHEQSTISDGSPRAISSHSGLYRSSREMPSSPEISCPSIPPSSRHEQTAQLLGHPVPNVSNDLPPSITHRAPSAPMITNSEINQRGLVADESASKAVEPGAKDVMFTIRGAANGTLASANQKPSAPSMTKQPSIEGAPTGPLFPNLGRKQCPSKNGSNPKQLLPFVQQTKTCSVEEYPQLTNLPANATAVARRISGMPIQRDLRLRAKKRLAGLDKGDGCYAGSNAWPIERAYHCKVLWSLHSREGKGSFSKLYRGAWRIRWSALQLQLS